MAAAINELKQKRIEAKKSAEALLAQHLTAAQAGEGRGFSDEEKAAQAAAESKVKNLDELIAAEERRLELQAKEPGTRISVSAPNMVDDPKKGFKNHSEFLAAVMSLGDPGTGSVAQLTDERLKYLALGGKLEDSAAPGKAAFMLPEAFSPRFKATVGSDEQGTYDDRYGGYSVRPTFLPGMLQLGFEGDPTAGLTTSVPMASPMVEMLARTDKNHTTSVSGGFTVGRRAETGAFTASRGQMEMVTLKASVLAGLAYASEEILSDSLISFMAFIQAGFKDQFGHYMLGEKLRGLGGDQYIGAVTAGNGSLVSVAKVSGQTAATINHTNVITMRSRCWGYDQAIWCANHDCYPQLSTMAVPIGVGGQLIYQTSLVADRPDTLLGRPIHYTEYASTLGTQGDLILANWSQFLEGTYQPLQSAESIHVRFLNHERTFKFWLRNAGAPWWKTALTPNKSSQTLSPFVVLDTRA